MTFEDRIPKKGDKVWFQRPDQPSGGDNGTVANVLLEEDVEAEVVCDLGPGRTRIVFLYELTWVDANGGYWAKYLE